MTKFSSIRSTVLRQQSPLAIVRGIIGILLLNAVFVTVCILCVPTSVLFSYLLVSIGFSQFVYAVPLMMILIAIKRWGILKGVLIGNGLTALLNAGYFLILILKR